MGVAASIIQEHTTVEPGGEAFWNVLLQNTGSVVDQFTLEILGDAVGWTWVEPPTVELLPSAQETVRLAFAPPRSSAVVAGPLVVGVKVNSREDPDGGTVEEATLEVGRFTELVAEVVPRTSKGAWRGKHELAVDNRGNVPATVEVSAYDADEQLRLDLDPSSLPIEAGAVGYAALRVRPRKRMLYGEPKTLPFQAMAKPAEGDPVVADGNLLRTAIVPKWAPRALAALAALAIAWFMLLRPTIESQARDSVSGPIARQAERLDKLEAVVGQQSPPPTDGPDGPDGPDDPEDPPTPSPTVTPGPPAQLGAPFDRRLQLNSSGTDVESYTVPNNRRLSVTDLVLGNPNGDRGTVRFRRGDRVLLEVGLDNFRDLDYHFVSPMLFGPGQRVTFSVRCTDPGVGNTCRPAAYVIGTMRAI